jgi:hypothetical protein
VQCKGRRIKRRRRKRRRRKRRLNRRRRRRARRSHLILGNRPCTRNRVAFLGFENCSPRSALALCYTG